MPNNKEAEYDQDKAIINGNCNQVKRLPNKLKKLIRAISYLTPNTKEAFT